MGLMDVLGAIGGGIKKVGGAINTGANYLEDARMDEIMSEKLGPDWEKQLAQESQLRQGRIDALPTEERAREADIESTQAGTAQTTQRTDFGGQLFPGELAEQAQDLQMGRVDLDRKGVQLESEQGDLAFQPEEQQMRRDQFKIGAASAGINPADIDGSAGEVSEINREGKESYINYQKALVQQIYTRAAQSGKANMTPSMIARMVENASNGGVMGQKDLSDPQVFDAVMQQVMQAIEMQERVSGAVSGVPQE